MLNHRRSRSYGNATPASCAVSIFGLGVALALGGIVLMVITKNAKNKDEPAIETSDRIDKGSSDRIITHNRHKKSKATNVMRTAGPILLGVGITIIVIFFLACTIVGCGRELRAPPSATYMSPIVDRPPNPSAPSSGYSVQISNTSEPDGLQKSLLPPSYDDICTGGSSSGGHVLLPLKPISS